MRRDPKRKASDRQLLEAIRVGLARAPFVGEGAHQAWARLDLRDGFKKANWDC
ncbi:MAG: hypothetical protein VB137_03905 [Burkholderia sp.]